MNDLNRVQLIGNVGADPQVRQTDAGVVVTTFSVGTTYRWRTSDGEEQARTEWTRCCAWDSLGQMCADFLHKGSRLYVAGRFKTRQWTDNATQRKMFSAEVVIDDMLLLDQRAVPSEDESPRSF